MVTDVVLSVVLVCEMELLLLLEELLDVVLEDVLVLVLLVVLEVLLKLVELVLLEVELLELLLLELVVEDTVVVDEVTLVTVVVVVVRWKSGITVARWSCQVEIDRLTISRGTSWPKFSRYQAEEQHSPAVMLELTGRLPKCVSSVPHSSIAHTWYPSSRSSSSSVAPNGAQRISPPTQTC